MRYLFVVPVVGVMACSGPKGDTGETGAAGPKGDTGGSCTVSAQTDGTKLIQCADGTSVSIKDGTNGANGTNGTNGQNGAAGANGTSCTVATNTDGSKTISCSDGTSATVTDGKDGKDGTNGSSCTVTTDATAGTSTITCPDGSTATVTNGENGDPGRSCTVQSVTTSTKRIVCDDGTTVTIKDGVNGANGTNVAILDHHGRAFLAEEELMTAGKYMASATITSAVVDANGVLTVAFTAKDASNLPLTGLRGVYFAVAALDGINWVPYLQRLETATAGAWPMPSGTKANQGNRENNGVLTDNNDGSYTYVFKNNLTTRTRPSDGAAITYDGSRWHRVALMFGGHNGPTASTTFDFIPAPAGTPPAKHDVMETATCKSCHGPSFTAHGGDRLTYETCSVCHTAGMTDAQSGESLDMRVMIHKIHAGEEISGAAGADGIFFDNPATPTDESVDNHTYTLWGYGNAMHQYKGAFPAVIENCTKCHTGTVANVDNWKTSPSIAGCTSCHAQTTFDAAAANPNHVNQTDAFCATCHGPGRMKDVTVAHNWVTKDPRNIPEFSVELKVSTPANGTHFVTGEAPVVTVKITDVATNALIDHTTMTEDAAAPTGDGIEGCLETGCPPADGKFANSGFFVHGPRAKNNPVLTMAARAKIASTTTGPWDLTAATSLIVVLDGAEDVYTTSASGAVVVAAGTVTATLPATLKKAGVTVTELKDWLNADVNFKRRAIAYEEGGKLTLRSRNLGKEFSIQLPASTVNTAVFGGTVTVVGLGGSTAKNSLAKRITSSLNDPKVTYFADHIEYALDPVDDLVPGTYTVNIEFQDRGRIDAVNYKTPSIAKTTFQVKQAAEEKPIAGNCNSCHQNKDGVGFVLDPSRHNKHFDFNATDQCTACHDYQSMTPTNGGWSGAVSINRRVHAVHNGADLNFPEATVGYNDPGRYWQIEFPQDIRNCQACHPDGQVSGTWAHNPSRLSCGSCHDSLAAQNHIKIMTWDPTPTQPFSGDEGESCSACHN